MKKAFIVFFFAAALTFAASCGSSGGTDNKTDDDINESVENGEVEESSPTISKCGEGVATKNPLTVSKEKGGIARVCEAGNEIDGSQIEVISEAVGEFAIDIKKGSADLQKAGYKAIGPAVNFGAPAGSALSYDVPITVPIDLSKLTADVRDYTINVLTAPLDGSETRFIPKNRGLIRIDRERGLVFFEWKMLGTFQVVTYAEKHETEKRPYTFTATAGVSMGAGGSSYIGFKNPDKFDVVGMLGGPIDLTYLAHMINNELMGGFCKPDEFVDRDGKVDEDKLKNPMTQCGTCMVQFSALDPECNLTDEYDYPWPNYCQKCALVPPQDSEQLEHPNGFNHWYYDDNGGNFDRDEYLKLFRDLALGFGNPLSYNPDSPYIPAAKKGFPIKEFVEMALKTYEGKDDTFCKVDKLSKWMSDRGVEYPFKGFYDAEYNPEGKYGVIFFCDGAKDSRTPWSGDFIAEKSGDNPMEVGLAVDVNNDMVRQFGEPVIRQSSEPYEDCGLDRLCDKDEPGYNASSNPDPNKDNYDPITNPDGKERNHLCDGCEKNECKAGAQAGLAGVCEKWEDFGLDGVQGTKQYADGGYDYGEGNEKFDYNPNLKNFYALDANQNIRAMKKEKLDRMHIYIDGGVRDLFNFGLHGNHLMGAVVSVLGPGGMTFYQGIETLMFPVAADLSKYNFLKVDYGKIGKNVLVRYGHINATAEQIIGGDGRHVGTPQEIVLRVQTFLGYLSYHFPNADISTVDSYDPTNMLMAGRFYSERMKAKRRYSVALPPGYDDNPDVY